MVLQRSSAFGLVAVFLRCQRPRISRLRLRGHPVRRIDLSRTIRTGSIRTRTDRSGELNQAANKNGGTQFHRDHIDMN